MSMQIIKKGDTLINGITLGGDTENAIDLSNKSKYGNALLLIKSLGGDIFIKDCVFNIKGYNCIEGYAGAESSPKHFSKNVLIENCNFNGTLKNNAISFYNLVDGAEITIKNCRFKNISNLLRLSNNLNSHISVLIEDCVVEKGESGNYRGLVCLQDYTTKDGLGAEMFSKVKITLKNVIYSDGVHVTKTNDLVDETNVIFDGTENQDRLIYLWCDKDQNFVTNEACLPEVVILK